MHDIEPLKPTNTGWLVADLVTDTEAFTWSRTEPDARLLAMLDDPQWRPYVVFPTEHVAPERVVRDVTPVPGRRPLFVLLDGSWSQASRMFRKSRYLDRFPVLGLHPEQLTRYRLRCTRREERLCTAEVAALCLALAGEEHAARALDAWLDVFIERNVDVRATRAVNAASPVHERLAAIVRSQLG